MYVRSLFSRRNVILSFFSKMGSSLDELLKAEFKEAFDEFDKVKFTPLYPSVLHSLVLL